MKKWINGSLVLGLVLAGSAHAADRQWDTPGTGYVELSGGMINYDNICHSFTDQSNAANAYYATQGITTQWRVSSCDHTATGVKVLLGAHITRHVFGELFYLNYGKATTHVTEPVHNYNNDLTVKGQAVGGQIGWQQPLGPVDLFFKAGEARARLESKQLGHDASAGLYISTSNTKYVPVASLGGALHVWRRLSLTLDYDRLFNVGGGINNTGKTDVSFYNAGIRYSF